jgi:ornithine carbamoyltransferase
MTRHFLNLVDAGGDGVVGMLNDALDRNAARAAWPKGKVDADAPLAGHVLAMVFEKNSTPAAALALAICSGLRIS